MKKKIYLIAITAVLLLASIVFFVRMNNYYGKTAIEAIDNSSDTAQVPKEDEQKDLPVAKTTRSTKVISGKVISINEDSIAVQAGKISQEISISSGVYIYANSGGKIVSKSRDDLKAGMSVAIEYDEANYSALAVKIIR